MKTQRKSESEMGRDGEGGRERQREKEDERSELRERGRVCERGERERKMEERARESECVRVCAVTLNLHLAPGLVPYCNLLIPDWCWPGRAGKILPKFPPRMPQRPPSRPVWLFASEQRLHPATVLLLVTRAVPSRKTVWPNLVYQKPRCEEDRHTD